jgi:aspartyl-tRNA(Asn)/glutamyl-tRNA(Gln) amidotransferase subunit B
MRFFDAVSEKLSAEKDSAALIVLAANYIVSDLGGYYAKVGGEEFANVTAESFVELVYMIAANELSSRGAKDVLLVMAESGGSAKAIATEKGMLQVSDPEALRTSVREVLVANPAVVEEFKAGKESVIQFLVGQSMKATKGAGNPGLLRDLLLDELSR